MNSISRRSVMTGLAAAVARSPASSVSAARSDELVRNMMPLLTLSQYGVGPFEGLP